MVDRENVVAQKNLETAPFGKVRNVLSSNHDRRKRKDIFEEGLWKAFLFRKRIRKLRRGTKSMSLNLFRFYEKVEEIRYCIEKRKGKRYDYLF